MDLAAILANIADQDRGAEFELVDPVTAEPTGIKLTIAGPDSNTAARARVELYDELAELTDGDGRVSAANREKARLNALAKLVLRWEIVEEGKPLVLSHANVVRLLRAQWVHEQVDAFAADRRAHRRLDHG